MSVIQWQEVEDSSCGSAQDQGYTQRQVAGWKVAGTLRNVLASQKLAQQQVAGWKVAGTLRNVLESRMLVHCEQCPHCHAPAGLSHETEIEMR